MATQRKRAVPPEQTNTDSNGAQATTAARGQRVGYVRVSTLDQKTARQLEGVPIDRVFTDKASGKDTNRPQLLAALEYLREGDTLVCHSMDRLARNLEDLRRVVRELTERGVAVEFVKEHLTFTGSDSGPARLMLSLMGAFAEFERDLIRERQREGIAIAKTKPEKYKGRKPALDPARVEALRNKDRENGGKGRAALARDFGISRETLYQYLKVTDTPKTEDRA